jgi:nucleoside-diphosphate-sugar epimerase
MDNPDWSQIEGLLGGGVEVLVHLAAYGVNPMEAEWDECFRYNTVQPIKLWRQAIDRGLRRLVVCGSFFEYGRSGERYDYIPHDAPLEPTGAYGASKAAASLAACALAMESMIELAILRPALVFGEGEAVNRLWPSLRKAALAGDDFPMTQGEQVRDFVPVNAVAEVFADSVSRDDLTKGFPLIENVGSGNPRRLIDFAMDWWKHWEASGRLLPGAIPYRDSECMRYVPLVRNPVS